MADLTVPSLSADEAKAQVLWAAQEMLRTGLVEGTAGNIAARLPDGNAVLTPSSIDYDTMTLDDLAICDLDGNQISGKGATSEKALHLGVLRKYPEVHATIHCHAKTVQMFAITHQPIPAVVEEFDVYVGGDVECTDYKETGSQELADEVASKIDRKGALIMANHGLFTVGKTPKDALKIALLVERTAEVVLGARLLGEIIPVPKEIGEKYSSYYRYGRTGKF
jgi:L-fuculose-phosphate aldolase